MEEVYDDIAIDKMLDKQHNDFFTAITKWTHEGSGLNIQSILQHQLVISEISALEGSSYFPLTEELNNLAKGFINIQN